MARWFAFTQDEVVVEIGELDDISEADSRYSWCLQPEHGSAIWLFSEQSLRDLRANIEEVLNG